MSAPREKPQRPINMDHRPYMCRKRRRVNMESGLDCIPIGRDIETVDRKNRRDVLEGPIRCLILTVRSVVRRASATMNERVI
jgi:hypothetical protein